jgi:hypothetical protein
MRGCIWSADLCCVCSHTARCFGIWDIAGAVGNLVSCHHPCGTVNPRRAPTPGFGCHTGCPAITQACTCTTYRAFVLSHLFYCVHTARAEPPGWQGQLVVVAHAQLDMHSSPRAHLRKWAWFLTGFILTHLLTPPSITQLLNHSLSHSLTGKLTLCYCSYRTQAMCCSRP